MEISYGWRLPIAGNKKAAAVNCKKKNKKQGFRLITKKMNLGNVSGGVDERIILRWMFR
jgi:hypothetical protein